MGKFIAFLLGLAGAVAGSQAPGFTIQYLQHLQGRVDEISAILETFDGAGSDAADARDATLAECREAQGAGLRVCEGYIEAVARQEYLTAHLAELDAAGPYMRPITLALNFDREIAESVAARFEPAIPTTGPGAAYAAGGFAGLWLLAQLLFAGLGAVFGGGRDRAARRGPSSSGGGRMNASDML
ncbi:MAG: hypothetical protein Tsb0010_13530 [Parvularculaceae bacterium]